jgi:hypothetical protein
MEKEPTPPCPRCPSERLVRVLANLLVCPNCEITFVETRNANNWVGKVELLPDVDNT